MTWLMMDLETFGTRPGCVLRSIGAVMFTEEGDLGDEFYANIDHQSCLDLGMFVDPATAAWWEKQSQQAKDSLMQNQRPIREVMGDFRAWYLAQRGTALWAQGSSFDPPLVEEAFRLLGIPAPWKYWDTRDTRTVYDLAKFNTKSMPRDGLYHNALDDCKYQVRCVATAIKKIRMMG
jgi:hypothetical protein